MYLLSTSVLQLVPLRCRVVVPPFVVVEALEIGEELLTAHEATLWLERIVSGDVVLEFLLCAEALVTFEVVTEVLERIVVELHVLLVMLEKL